MRYTTEVFVPRKKQLTPMAGKPLRIALPKAEPCEHEGEVVKRCVLGDGGTVRECKLLGGTCKRNSVGGNVADRVCKDCVHHTEKPMRADCAWLGDVKSRRNASGHVTGAEGKWLRECQKYGECRVDEPWPGKTCKGCTDYRMSIDEPDFDTRHLLYHVYPMKGTGTWQRNCDHILRRLNLFNGRKVVAIVVDEKTDDPEAVKQHMRGCEFIVLENDYMLREVVSWIPLWKSVINLPGCTFYAHAKGTSRPWNPGVSCHWWADVMYETLLDYWPLVRDSLQSHPITGTFKKVGRGFTGCISQWHYSGSFFWTRNELFRKRDWKEVPQQWWGSEAVTGVLFKPDEAGCVFHPGTHPGLDCYKPDYMRSRVLPELAAWRSKHSMSRSDTGI